jgi:hypothetical protein
LGSCGKDTQPQPQEEERTVTVVISEITDSSAVATLAVSPVEAFITAGVIYATDSLQRVDRSEEGTGDLSDSGLRLQLKGLRSGTTYYYKGYAEDKSGAYIYGSLQTFATNMTPALDVSVERIDATADGGEYTFGIASNISWTIASGEEWCNVSPVSGSGDAEVTVIVGNNHTTTARTAVVTVAAGSIVKQVGLRQEASATADGSIFYNGIIAAGRFGGGDGSQASPYLIYSARQLKKLVDDVYGGQSYADACFRLNTDISVTADEWIPIGQKRYLYLNTISFSGIFDGGGHTIAGQLQTTRRAETQVYKHFGFFGCIDGGSVHDLTVTANVHTEWGEGNCIGGITGAIDNGSISNCHFSGRATNSSELPGNIGGIAGYIGYTGYAGNDGYEDGDAGTTRISDCTVSGYMSIQKNVGGIVGLAYPKNGHYVLTDCTLSGTVEAVGLSGDDWLNVGGIVGASGYSGEITNCTVSTSASVHGVVLIGNACVGGIIGDASANSNLNITGSTNHAGLYAAREDTRVGKSTYAGGIAGRLDGNSYVHTCLNTGKISVASYDSNNYGGGLAGSVSGDAAVYSCSTGTGVVSVLNNGIPMPEHSNPIGIGGSVTNCPDGHQKR